MRTQENLWGTVIDDLQPYLRGHIEGQDFPSGMSAIEICEVEQGLFLLCFVIPQAPAKALWALLIGYSFATDEFSDEQRRQTGIARHILLHYKSFAPLGTSVRAVSKSKRTNPSLRR